MDVFGGSGIVFVSSEDSFVVTQLSHIPSTFYSLLISNYQNW